MKCAVSYTSGRRGDTAEFEAVTACREESADVDPEATVKSASVKQEPEQETSFVYVV